jgi:CubicO group peptidase (beta-lactamase class C family)
MISRRYARAIDASLATFIDPDARLAPTGVLVAKGEEACMSRLALFIAALIWTSSAAQAQVTRSPVPPGQARGPVAATTVDPRFPSRFAPAESPSLRAAPRATWRLTPPPVWTNPQTQVQIAPQVVANRIADLLEGSLGGKAVGVSVTLMMPGGEFASGNWGKARASVDSPARDWTANDRISVASVSKTITAAAVVRLAAQRGVSLDTAAWTLLPTDWFYSPSFKTITVRELLAHTSGIRGCDITHVALQLCAIGTINPADKGTGPAYGTRYNNANYAFLRIILTQIADGYILSTARGIGERYVALVNQHVLGPAGVGAATCSSPAINPPLSYLSATDDGVEDSTAAVNYSWAKVDPGIDWGDMTEVCGSQGWNLSSRQLATFANALMVSDRILPRATVETMQSELLGLQYYDFGGGLTAYGHRGYHPGPSNGGEVNTLILTFNNGISLGLVLNSRFYNNDQLSYIDYAVREGWWR